MKNYDIAVYGLGVMGSSLAKNMINKGFKVAAFSKSEAEKERFALNGKEDSYVVCSTKEQMLSSLKSPRIIFLMITAGAPVDSVIEDLLPALEPGDIVIDGGNSYFKDTSRRYNDLKEKGICYMGVGVSGGEKGALLGPSMMAGGSKEGWEASKHILKTIAAYYKDEPCCTYIGPEGAGHYVKMVHNGIEYAILQLIAETYHIMKYGLNLEHHSILGTFKNWKNSKLDSYLIDISVTVLEKMDEDNTPLVNKILDVAEQKGTGKWTLEEAIDRGVYIPTIFEAVFARSFSSNKEIRVQGNKHLSHSGSPYTLDDYEKKLGEALLAGVIASYAQGMALIAKASEENGWKIDLSELASVWREGCIIRSVLLSEVKESLKEEKENLMLSEAFHYITKLEPALREVVTKTSSAAIAVPALASALNYYDYFRMEQMPVNFVQALRDCFGAHTYKRVDKEGYFHTEWEK